jgi:MFS transporter, SHS family, lactate transporter
LVCKYSPPYLGPAANPPPYSGAWTADGYDFNAVNLVATNLSEVFDRPLTDITLSITLTLLFRSIGAFIFGMLADSYGRKWPLAIDLFILAVLQVGTAYAGSFQAFIGVRAIFGIAMGGVWGLSAAISLENMPVDCRGLFSGILQQGYALGYLIAAVINLTAVRYSGEGWKAIFHVGAGFTGLMAILVCIMPESKIYKDEEDIKGWNERARAVGKDLKKAARQYWGRFLYCVILSMGFNWMSHGSQGTSSRSAHLDPG